MKILITGMSGTGKSTLLKYFQEKEKKVLGLDEEERLCEFFDKTSGQVFHGKVVIDRTFIEKYDWICNIPKLQEILKQEKDNIFVFGSAENYEELFSNFDKVFLLHVEPEVFLKRIDQRDDNDFGKHPELQKYLLDTYKKYEDQVKEKGAIPIHTGKSVEEIYQEIMTYLA